MKKNVPNDMIFNEIIKNHWGQIIALLNKQLHDIELAEDVMQDALLSALSHWDKNGLPHNPQGWLFTVAKHKALDKLRRDKNFEIKAIQYKQLIDLNSDSVSEDEYSIPDERLRLIFTCCHPSLDQSVSVALTLQLVGGLSTEEIAKAYLIKKTTMAQRLVRGKRKIKLAGIPFEIPERENFKSRLDSVLKVLYLIFNEGYTDINQSLRFDLSSESIRLAEILMNLCPNQTEVKGLLALMLLNDSRKKSRYSKQRGFIPLDSQDRSLWNAKQIKRGQLLIQSALKQKNIGFYQLQAAISAIHSEATDFESTNWSEIVLVYDELLKINSSSVIKLNRLMAVSQIKLDDQALRELETLEKNLKSYQPYYAVKADFLVRLGQHEKSKQCFKKAISLTNNQQVKDFISNKLLSINST